MRDVNALILLLLFTSSMAIPVTDDGTISGAQLLRGFLGDNQAASSGDSIELSPPEVEDSPEELPAVVSETAWTYDDADEDVEDIDVTASKVSADEWENFRLTNAKRAQGFTCPKGNTYDPNNTPLIFDCRLWKASQLHSQDMGEKGYFAHNSQDGRTPWQRASAQGISANGENIAAGGGSAQAALDQWMNSDGHCNNIGKPSFKMFGVGKAVVSGSQYTNYWTEMFKTSVVTADTSCYPSGSGGGGGGGGGPAPAPTPVANPSCKDKQASSRCSGWKNSGYCAGKYASWMATNCAKTCGKCGGGGSSPATHSHNPHSHNPHSHTPHSHNPHSHAPPKTEPVNACSDASSYASRCPGWKSFCSSSKFANFMKTNCPKTCGKCGGAADTDAPVSSGGGGGGGGGGDNGTCGGKEKFVQPCGNCVDSSQCNTGFCCPYMKKCVSSSRQTCVGGATGWAKCRPTCHKASPCPGCKGANSGFSYPDRWVNCNKGDASGP